MTAVGELIGERRVGTTLSGKTAIAGIGETAYYKRGGTPDAEFKMALQATLAAAEDAGLDPRRIDGFSEKMQTVMGSGVGVPDVSSILVANWFPGALDLRRLESLGDDGTDLSLFSPLDAARGEARLKVFRHASVGLINLTSVSLAIDGMTEHRIVVYTPADDRSRAQIERLRALDEPVIGCPVHRRKVSEIIAEREAERDADRDARRTPALATD